ncbi:MAG: hypothetical protein KGJ39_01315 [Acidobacteriota bacterium]|nr:hypothetical protein [Acidobacteriota bacterium]
MHFSPTRRALLQGLGATSLAALLADRAGAAGVPPLRLPALATASWVATENARAGDPMWLAGDGAPAGTLEAYTDAPSYALGETLSAFVSSTAARLTAKVYRVGYYQGLGARLVETVSNIPAQVRAVPAPDALGTVDCDWPVTFRLDLDARYLPGQYLIRLENESGRFRFVPFLVRDDVSTATFLYLSAVTTWQAYNTWGGFSLYRQSDVTGDTIISNATRAVRVSFNRPYARSFANGAADFIGNEFPLLFLAESLGLDLAYWTDLDLHVRGSQVTQHRAVLSLGHDEYYSGPMRDALVGAVASGVNVAFFGANFIFRKIRFEPSVNGALRLMVNYRSSADPIIATNPSLATVNWASYPADAPSSTFSGSSYGGAQGVGSLSVADAATWFWRGSGVSDATVLVGALGGEFNRFNPFETNPPSVQILGHSVVGGGLSDVTYSAEPGRGGVWCSGTGQWVFHLSNAPRLGGHWVPNAIAATAALRTATQNLLALFAQGPAGDNAPSRDNTAAFYG